MEAKKGQLMLLKLMILLVEAMLFVLSKYMRKELNKQEDYYLLILLEVREHLIAKIIIKIDRQKQQK
jgi:hypothetical protein